MPVLHLKQAAAPAPQSSDPSIITTYDWNSAHVYVPGIIVVTVAEQIPQSAEIVQVNLGAPGNLTMPAPQSQLIYFKNRAAVVATLVAGGILVIDDAATYVLENLNQYVLLYGIPGYGWIVLGAGVQ